MLECLQIGYKYNQEDWTASHFLKLRIYFEKNRTFSYFHKLRSYIESNWGFTHYSLTLLFYTPENIRKPKGFVMFPGGIEKQHRAVTG